MSLYLLLVEGCDDTTEVVVSLTREQHETVSMLTDKINAAARSGCMPKMSLIPVGVESATATERVECSAPGSYDAHDYGRYRDKFMWVEVSQQYVLLYYPDSERNDEIACMSCATAGGYAPDGAA